VDTTKVAPCGIIKRMTLRNFLNHRHFNIAFNPNVNFISGANGAGKSSILHAIQVVFGSRAQDTNRGSKIADLIHHGRDEASIEVLVKNEGDGAFKHDLYGDTIAIVKRIRRTGAGSTRVINHSTGAEVSRSPSEVGEMCAHFNILVSNPCVLMTQEVSKKFLQSKKAEDKYTFFLQATQLEWLRSSLAESKLNILQMERTVAVQREKIPDLERKIQELRRQEALAQEAESLQKEIDHMYNLRAWRDVLDHEIEFDKKEHERDVLVAERNKTEAKRQQLADSFGGMAALDEAKQLHGSVIERESQQLRDLGNRIADSDAGILRVKHEQKSLLSKIDQLRKRVTELKKRRAANERQIAAIAEANARDTSAADAKLNEKEERLQAEKVAIENKMKKLGEEVAKLSPADMERRQELADLTRGATDAHARLQAATRNLQTVRESAGPGQGAAAAAGGAGGRQHNHELGMQTARIWRFIKSESWQVEPIGPLGEYVQIPAEKEPWLKAATECLTRKHMSSYLVDNFHDQSKLQNFISRLWKENNERALQPVIVKLRKDKRFAVVRPKVPFPLVLDCLQIDDPWAYNAVVFLCKPERFGLHTEFDAAVRAIRPFRAVHQKGSNDYVNGSILPDGGKVSIKGSSHDGAVTSERASEPQLFRVSQAEKIRELEAAVASNKADYEQVQSLTRAKKAEVDAGTRELHRIKGELRTLQGRRDEVIRALGLLEDEREQQRLQQEKQDDSHLVQANIDAQNEQHEVEGQIEKLQQQDDARFAERIAELEARRAEDRAELVRVQARIDAEQEKLSAFTRQWAKDESKLRKYTAAVAELDTRVHAADAEFAAQSQTLEDTEKRANSFSPERPKPEELRQTCRQLDAAITFKEDTLREKLRSTAVDLLQVQLELKTTQLEKAKTEGGMAKVLANTTGMKDANHDRVQKMKAYRKRLSEDANFVFNELLGYTGGSGRLAFDFANRTLDLIVNPNIADAEREDARDTVALSGGERSTTTIAFVMAVGEQVDCPIRAIDEFDVFMDPINRKRALDVLLTIGSKRKDRQFFFLSPLDVTHIKPTPFLTLHRLVPPVRDQTTMDTEGQIEIDDEGERKEDDE